MWPGIYQFLHTIHEVFISHFVVVRGSRAYFQRPYIKSPLQPAHSCNTQCVFVLSVSPDDFTAQNIIRTFGECTTSLCVNIPIKNDSTLEQEVEVFEVLISLESEASLHNIILTQNETTVFIMDTDGKNSS